MSAAGKGNNYVTRVLLACPKCHCRCFSNANEYNVTGRGDWVLEGSRDGTICDLAVGDLKACCCWRVVAPKAVDIHQICIRTRTGVRVHVMWTLAARHSTMLTMQGVTVCLTNHVCRSHFCWCYWWCHFVVVNVIVRLRRASGSSSRHRRPFYLSLSTARAWTMRQIRYTAGCQAATRFNFLPLPPSLSLSATWRARSCCSNATTPSPPTGAAQSQQTV